MISINVCDDQRELKRHGTYAFPVAVYHYVMSECSRGFIDWHWHAELQLNLVTRGSICFYTHGKQYIVREGDGFFVGSSRLHMARPEGDPDSSYLCLDFHPRLIGSFPGSIYEYKFMEPFLGRGGMDHMALKKNRPEQGLILSQIKGISNLMKEKEFGYELEVQSRIIRLWLSLISLFGAKNTLDTAPGHDTTQEIIRYLHQHYQEPVSLEGVGRAVGFSTSECCRIFKRVTGDTILNYLRSYRLTKSIELLQETDLSISQIAYESGFNGASYYIESFKKELGQTPLQYRRRAVDVKGV